MKILLLFVVFQGWQEPQEQKNTALLQTVPQVEDLTIRAAGFAARKNYAAALDIYDPVWKKYPNHTVPVSETLSVGVRPYILDQISRWPPGGKAVYRKRVDPLVRDRFERARRTRDPGLLVEIITRYPFSSVAPAAALLRADLLLDRGSPEEAAHILEPLLAEKGEGALPVSVVAARLGLAFSLSGKTLHLRALVREAERKWPEATLQIHNEKKSLVEFLRILLQRTVARPPAGEPLEIPEWPVVGGSPDGNGIAETNVPLGRRAWRLPVSPANHEFQDNTRFRFQPQSKEHHLPLFPVVSDGIVYVHNEYSVFALPLFSNGVDLVWSFRRQTPPGTLMFDDRLVHTVTVHEGLVYANLITSLGHAEERLGYVRVKFPFPGRALFALDAYTGKEKWKRGGGKGKYSYPLAPTPVGDRLYVGVVRQEHSTDPFEHHVVCLDAATGAVLWDTFVASGLTEINLFGNSTRESIGTPVSVQGDLVYYGTNHGVLAALNRNTGRIEWIHRYRQIPVLPTRSIQIRKNPLEWVNVPPVIAEGMVIFTPTDSRHLQVLNAFTGREAWHARRRPDMRLLYGVRKGTVVVGGDTLCFYDLTTGRLVDLFHPRSPGRGRGVLSEGEIYMPTRTGLQRINSTTRASSGFTRWKGDATGGNLVIVDGAVLLSGTRSVEAYFDRRSFEKEADEILAQNPDHIGILYRSAVRFSQSGKDEKALPLFRKVLEKGRASTSAAEQRLARACQLRLHRLHLRNGSKALSNQKREEADDHFREAIRLAVDLQGRLKATDHLARSLESAGKPDAAIAALHKLFEESDDLLVSREVREKVSAILRRNGRSCYAQMEERARTLLGKARERGTPESLLDVSGRWPNSLSAEQAVLEAVDLYEKLGRERDHVATLRTFLREYPRSKGSPQAHVRLIVALEKRKQVSSALTLLSRLARLWPESRVRSDGVETTAKAFAESRMKRDLYRNMADRARNVPLKPPLSLVLRHVEKGRGEGLLVRVGGARPEKFRDHIFLRYRKTFVAITLGGNRWTLSMNSPLLFAHFHEEDLLLATSSVLHRIDPETGKKIWSRPSSSPMRGFALVGHHVCWFTTELRARSASVFVAVDAWEGTTGWRQVFEGDPSTGIHRAGDLAIFSTRYPPVLHAYDAETGAAILHKRLASGDVLRKVFRAMPGRVILHSPHRFLEAYSLPDGKRSWAVDLDFFSVPVPVAAGDSILVFGNRRGRRVVLAGRVDPATGKFKRLVEKPGLGDIQYVAAGEDRVHLVSLDRNRRELVVSALDIDDLQTKWTVRHPDSGGTALPPAAAGEILVLPRFSRGPNGAFRYSISLLDRRGKRVQNIKSGFQHQRPPVCDVEEGRVVLTVDGEIRVYR